MGFQSIVVAVDQTDEADEVLTKAAALADAATVLSVVTVLRPVASLYTGSMGLPGLPPQLAGMDDELQSSALAGLERLLEKHGLTGAERHVRLGKPSIEIRRLAEEKDADLIVIGTHGRSGLGLMLGSTANAVLHGVGCDVYVVKVMAD